jgi:hypothetical protein
MASREILNITTNRPIKLSRAKRLVDLCNMEWVSENRIVRELTRQERLEAIGKRAEHAEPVGFRYRMTSLPPIEPNNCKFVQPETSKTSEKTIKRLTWAAWKFYENAESMESSLDADSVVAEIARVSHSQSIFASANISAYVK